MKKIICGLCFLLVLTIASPVFAQVVHDESVDGDLSGVFSAPDPLAFVLGANTIIGQMGNNGDTGATNGQDADYFLFSIGAGQQLSSITVDAYTFSPDDPNLSFMAYVEGTAFAGQALGDIDGQALWNASSGDLLPGFANTFDAGDYSFWLQETSANVVDYTITFNVAVPEPSSLLGCGCLGMLAMVRRRRS